MFAATKLANTAVFTRFAAENMQKQLYLQGFLNTAATTYGFIFVSLAILQKACENNNIYKVFCKKAARVAQAAQAVQTAQAAQAASSCSGCSGSSLHSVCLESA